MLFAQGVMTMILARSFAGFGLLALGATAYSISPAAAAESSADTAKTGLRVTVVPASRRCFPDTLETAGRVMPREEIFVRPEIEGLRVSQVLVEDGDRVTEGAVLARLGRAEGQSGTLPAAATIKAPAAGVIS